MKRITLLAATAVVVAAFTPTQRSDAQSGADARLPEAAVRFEQNASDGDVEVVFDAGGAPEGLAKLIVRSPDGRIVIDCTAPDGSTMGIRSFRFESPEPSDVAALQAAYPAGVYSFSGKTVSGVNLHGEATLSHELPPTVSFLQPAEESEDVATKGLKITWSPVDGMAAYIVEIEQEELHLSITAKLPASAASFIVPDGFLLAGTEYKLIIGTQSAVGNMSFVETSFETASDD